MKANIAIPTLTAFNLQFHQSRTCTFLAYRFIRWFFVSVNRLRGNQAFCNSTFSYLSFGCDRISFANESRHWSLCALHMFFVFERIRPVSLCGIWSAAANFVHSDFTGIPESLRSHESGVELCRIYKFRWFGARIHRSACEQQGTCKREFDFQRYSGQIHSGGMPYALRFTTAITSVGYASYSGWMRLNASLCVSVSLKLNNFLK